MPIYWKHARFLRWKLHIQFINRKIACSFLIELSCDSRIKRIWMKQVLNPYLLTDCKKRWIRLQMQRNSPLLFDLPTDDPNRSLSLIFYASCSFFRNTKIVPINPVMLNNNQNGKFALLPVSGTSSEGCGSEGVCALVIVNPLSASPLITVW